LEADYEAGTNDSEWTTLFTGRELDPESGLYYFRARYFSDIIGLFIRRDLLLYVNGANIYYPYFVPNRFDPAGKEACTFTLYVGHNSNVVNMFSSDYPDAPNGMGDATFCTGVGCGIRGKGIQTRMETDIPSHTINFPRGRNQRGTVPWKNACETTLEAVKDIQKAAERANRGQHPNPNVANKCPEPPTCTEALIQVKCDDAFQNLLKTGIDDDKVRRPTSQYEDCIGICGTTITASGEPGGGLTWSDSPYAK